MGMAPTCSASLATTPTYAPAGLFHVVQSPLPAPTRYSSRMSGFSPCDCIVATGAVPRPTSSREGKPSLAASIAAGPDPELPLPVVPLPLAPPEVPELPEPLELPEAPEPPELLELPEPLELPELLEPLDILEAPVDPLT